MDVVIRMLDHHLWLVGEIVDRTADRHRRGARPADRALASRASTTAPTLRSISDRLVGQLEMWVDAVGGRHPMPAEGDRTAAGLRGPPGRRRPRGSARWSCPRSRRAAPTRRSSTPCASRRETFTYGGVVAHVLTFAAVRRTLAIGALETAGVTDLGSGDPMHFVGGSGADASTIERTPPEADPSVCRPAPRRSRANESCPPGRDTGRIVLDRRRRAWRAQRRRLAVPKRPRTISRPRVVAGRPQRTT